MDLPGTTTEALFETFRSWSINGEPAGHMDAYLADSFCRFVHTLELVGPNSTGRCLEIGANPYFTTHLLAQFTALDLTLINFYGDHGRGTRTTEQLSYASPGVVETTLALDSDLLNVEEDALPHPDGAFDVVLFCEVLEHLLMDPLAVLREIHRVLRPNGALVLSTPNVARAANVSALVTGANLYDPYSGFGPYGRHNREYNRHELHRLVQFAGFEVEVSFTANGHVHDPAALDRYADWAPLVTNRLDDLGDYLFVRARKSMDGRPGLPSWLYRSWPDGAVVEQ